MILAAGCTVSAAATAPENAPTHRCPHTGEIATRGADEQPGDRNCAPSPSPREPESDDRGVQGDKTPSGEPKGRAEGPTEN